MAENMAENLEILELKKQRLQLKLKLAQKLEEKNMGSILGSPQRPLNTGDSSSQQAQFETLEFDPGNLTGRIGGGTLYGILGGIAGMNPGTAAMMAGLGEGGGDAAEQLIKRLLKSRLEKTEPEIARHKYKLPETATEASRNITKSGIIGMFSDLVGTGTTRQLSKLIPNFTKTITPESRQATDFIKKNLKGKTFLTPQQATKSRALDVAGNIGSGSLFGGGKLQEHLLNQEEVVQAYADRLLKKIYPREIDPSSAGQMIAGAVNKKVSPARTMEREMFEEVKDMVKPVYKEVPAEFDPIALSHPIKFKTVQVGGARIDNRQTKQFANMLIGKAKQEGEVGSQFYALSDIKKIADQPNFIDFETAQGIRSKLLKLADKFEVENKKDPAIKLYRTFASKVDQSIAKQLQDHFPNAYEKWRIANNFTKKLHSRFDNLFVRRIIYNITEKENPVASAKLVESMSKPDMIKLITAVDEQTKRKIQRLYSQYLFINAETGPQKIISGFKLNKLMTGKHKLGNQGMDILYGKKTADNFREYVNLLKVIQNKYGDEGVGRMFVQLNQAGAAVQLPKALLTGRGVAKPLTFIGGPALMARIMTNEKASKYLFGGMRLGPYTKQTSAFFIRAVTEAGREGMESEREQQKNPIELLIEKGKR